MDGMIKFNGVIGVLLLLATAALLTLIIIIMFIGFMAEVKSPNTKSQKGWSRYFLLFALIFLLFDGAFFLQGQKNFTSEKAAVFDERMMFIWIPAHVIGFFFFAYLFRFVQKHKTKINEQIDKLR